MKRYEYIRIKLADIPQEIINQYDLTELAHNGYVYLEVRKGIYGLSQAGLLAYNLLVTRLEKHGYEPCNITTGLWKHKTRPIMFILTVDNFSVKYIGKHNAIHLLNALKQNYEIAVDWSGT